MSELVRAAGGVVWRRSDTGDIEVLLVHRPRYDDWSLPKGKLDADDIDEAHCTWREVAEETGFECTLGRELISVHYTDRKQRPKRVRFWAMQPVAGEFHPSDEVDAIEWVPVEQAGDRVSYASDRDVLRSFG